MRRILIVILLFAFQGTSVSQNRIFREFPTTLLTLQYAGSTGFLSLGYSRVTAKDKLELGVMAGYVPRRLGGSNNSLTLKSIYNPFQLHVDGKLLFDPIQTGIFVTRNFGEQLGLQWSNKYPKGYYWWTASVRFHFSLGSQLSYNFDRKSVKKLAVYFETNTNDLYVFSFLPNRKTIRLFDIFFFGTGIKLYLK